MSHEHTPEYDRSPAGAMQHAMGRGAQIEIIREALERIDGKPAPTVGVMQAAMGREARVQIAYEAIRNYLDERGLANTDTWIREQAAATELTAVAHASAQ